MTTAVTKKLSTREHAQGVVLVILVAFIWVASAELIQVIFKNSDYNKPFFLTYFSTCLFLLYFTGFLFNSSWRAKISAPPSSNQYLSVPHSDEYQVQSHFQHEFSSLSSPIAGATGADIDQADFSSSTKTTTFNVRQTMMLAIRQAPYFFIANLTFNIGLLWTSVASSSTISTLTSLFALMLGVFTATERFSYLKLASSIITIAGVALVGMFEKEDSGKASIAGDMISIFSSFIFALYTVSLKKHGGDHNSVSMPMMLSFLGAFVLLTAWPGLIIAHFLGWERFELPSAKALLLLIINGLIGTVLSDCLWMKSVQLTTPVISTLALTLSVPLSFASDYLFQNATFRWPYLIGAILVCIGFVMVNIDEAVYSEQRDLQVMPPDFSLETSDESSIENQ